MARALAVRRWVDKDRLIPSGFRKGPILRDKTRMLEDLDKVPWAELTHAYGSAEDVPDLLRALADPDPARREATIWELWGNLFHQGTRYEATSYAVPFLLELLAEPAVREKGELLRYLGSLVAGYFDLLNRPLYATATEVFHYGERIPFRELEPDERPFVDALAAIARETRAGIPLLLQLAESGIPAERGWSAYVLACLPEDTSVSAPVLRRRLQDDHHAQVRAAAAFALGELGQAEPLRAALDDDSPIVRCVAACELARIDPDPSLGPVLAGFLEGEIEGYDTAPGTGGEAAEDAAAALSHLPIEQVRAAVPALLQALGHARSFGVVPLAQTLLGGCFERTSAPPDDLDEMQRAVLGGLVAHQELWSIINLQASFDAHGIPFDRQGVADLVGLPAETDPAQSGE